MDGALPGERGPSVTSPELTGDVDFALIRQTAHDAYAAGLCVLPAADDGSKRPAGAKWGNYQTARPDKQKMRRLFAGDRHGLGVVCGAVSGNLELFEFDSPPAEEQFRELAAIAGLSTLLDCLDRGYSERTPGGGLHWLYRLTEPVAGSTKLASAPDGKTLIETRGEGGWVVVAPSGGKTHPTGRPYKMLDGSVNSIPELTSVEHSDLWNLARSLDQTPVRAESHASPGTGGPTGGRPGDHFNARATWSEVLSPYGWQLLHKRDLLTYWRRPGKPKGVSATTGLRNAADPTSDLLWVFSTSTAFEASRGYSKFSAYTMLKHGGDFPAAARTLAAQGYGGDVGSGITLKGTTPNSHKLTDYGNAERLAERYGSELHYLTASKQWLCWDGKRFRTDTTGAVMTKAKETARNIYAEAGAEPDDARRKTIADWSRQSESRVRLDAMLRLAESEPGIPVTPDMLDADPYLLNVDNGTLDLRTGVLRPHSQSDLITKIAPVAFDSNAPSDVWEQFLSRIMPDQDLRDFVQRGMGYTLIGIPSEDVLFLMHGPTRTGKSTFITAICATLGDYATVSDFEAFVKRRNVGGPRNDIARLAGARLVVASEVEDGQELASALVKGLTGGDTMAARFLHKEAFEFKPQFTLWIAANQRPRISENDSAMWERIREVPFIVAIPVAERDKNLKRTLIDSEQSRAAILAWLVRGCRDWQAGGLQTPDTVEIATDHYRESMDDTNAYRTSADAIAAFLSAGCVLSPGEWTTSAALRIEYEQFCQKRGEDTNMGLFHKSLEKSGVISGKHGHANTRGWKGIRLRSESEAASSASGASGGFSKPPIQTEINMKLSEQALATARSARSEQWEAL